jgi:hypothetical protein
MQGELSIICNKSFTDSFYGHAKLRSADQCNVMSVSSTNRQLLVIAVDGVCGACQFILRLYCRTGPMELSLYGVSICGSRRDDYSIIII